MKIYVGNLNYKVEENSLREIFEEYGEVSSVTILTDKYSGRSKGFGFVEMENTEEAQKAIQKLHNAVLDSRALVVNEARPKKERY